MAGSTVFRTASATAKMSSRAANPDPKHPSTATIAIRTDPPSDLVSRTVPSASFATAPRR